MRVSPGCLWPFYTHADLSPRTYVFNGSQLAKDIRPLFRDTPDVDSMKEYGLDLSSYVMRDFRCEHACKGVRETQRRVRIQSSPPASLTFSLSRWRSARKLDFAAQSARISHGQASNSCLKRRAGLAICSYFSEAGSGSGVSQAKLNHRFALTERYGTELDRPTVDTPRIVYARISRAAVSTRDRHGPVRSKWMRLPS